MLLGVAAQNEHAQVGRLGAHHGERVDAALAGHREVHHEHVDVGGAHEVDGLSARAGLADHAEVDEGGEERLEACADDGVVVDDADLDHGVVPA